MENKQLAPMPEGVQKMSKEELWDWFHRYTTAIMQKTNEERRFFSITTGLHVTDPRMKMNHLQIIEEQRKRIEGLELQMRQMQKGYKKKFAKLASKTH